MTYHEDRQIIHKKVYDEIVFLHVIHLMWHEPLLLIYYSEVKSKAINCDVLSRFSAFLTIAMVTPLLVNTISPSQFYLGKIAWI